LSSEDKEQFKVHIQRGISDKFREIVAKKWGIHKYGLLSHEVEQLLKFYISVGGILPESAHARTLKDIPEIKTSIMVSNEGGGEERNHDGPMEEAPLIKGWFLTQGLDLNNLDSIAEHVTEKDIEMGNKMLADQEYAKQLKKDSAAGFRRKKTRINYENWQSKYDERDIALCPELKVIKHHLRDADMTLNENTPLIRIQIHSAWVVATNKRDNRTFSVRLREYVDHGYFRAIGTKENKFKATDRLLRL
jgi:hypothetical protein